MRRKCKKRVARKKSSKCEKTRHVISGGTSGAIVFHSKKHFFFCKILQKNKICTFFCKICKSLRSGNSEKTPEIPPGKKSAKKVHKNFPKFCKFAKFGIFLTKIQ
ncbi:MAG: hypothetical protein COW43_00705 [Flavobacteriaceae bacterium CG17_big_fil_post_rev_8_21_14_2_50_31_13]|nr:MAG: hypothetical protein COW43_00705 [Flavobacteriaceae bacterium CG17_big_fil_post_rev_8_21_14_2_50_31_13]